MVVVISCSSGACRCAVVAVHTLAIRGLAVVVAALVPDPKNNVVVATLLSQFLLIINGFYTELAPWLAWTVYLSPPRYTFRALMKLEYSWRDSFEGHSHLGWSSRGPPSTHIPAQMTATFQDMRRKGLGIMDGSKDQTIYVEVLALTLVVLIGRLFLTIALEMGVRKMRLHP